MEGIIKDFFGEECFNEAKNNICKNRYNDWIKFENKIEKFKKIDKKRINSSKSYNRFQYLRVLL